MKFKWSFHTLSIIQLAISVLNLIVCSDVDGDENENNDDYSDYWLLKINGNLDEVKQLANEHKFKLLNKVGSLEGYYHVKLNSANSNLRHRRSNNADHMLELKKSEVLINSHPSVEIFQREKALVRTKRDYIEEHSDELFIDRKRHRKSSHKRLSHSHSIDKRTSNSFDNLIDPYWDKMWYLNRNTVFHSDSPDMNVTGAWEQGVSGRGTSVTFLDDGLEWDHPDIQQNYDALASTDINGADDDPMPRYDDSNENKHGTRCAGEVAAVANNSICSVGVAFNAGIGGIRMLDGDVTDSVEAHSLSFNRDHIDIYSASWGPDDNGEVVDGPGPLTKKAFSDGIALGRKGRGSIYVWASGNGGRFNDSCSCDGYANSIFTLSISSTSERGEKPWYLEECPSTLATTYSSGNQRSGEKEIITTDIRHKCTEKHTGTSAAAPIAAGIIALALEANPNLTWRDVMFLIVLSSNAKSIKSNNYIINKRGLLVSSRYGFGLMNAGKMVEMAKTWKKVPEFQSCSTLNSNFKLTTSQLPNFVEATLYTDACANSINEVNYIEQVEAVVSVRTDVRGKLEIFLTSPMGTISQLLPKRARDISPDGFKRWTFMSLQSWGEFPRGNWKLSVKTEEGSMAYLEDFMISIHGTKTKPVDYERYVDADTNVNTEICKDYLLEKSPEKFICVHYCPRGYYADEADKKCIKCFETCSDCDGDTKSNCISCNEGLFLNTTSNECISSCYSKGYFLNTLNQCQKCNSKCTECSHSDSFCYSCKEDDEKLKLTLKQNTCILNENSNCESGTYYNAESSECLSCDITCGECKSFSSKDCLSCSGLRPYLKHGQCEANCGDGFYLNTTSSHCFECNSNCKSCEEQGCLTCKIGFKLNDKRECVQDFLGENSCFDKNCYECYGKEKGQCFVCSNEYGLMNGQCIKSPPKGHFMKMIKTNRGKMYIFEKCSSFCDECLDEITCTRCGERSNLMVNQCYPLCDSESFVNADGKCQKCVEPCEKCSNLTYCLSCSPEKYLLEGKCLSKCPIGYFSAYFKCKRCHFSCDTCSGPEISNCLTCNLGFKYENNMCKSLCPDGTYYDSISNECAVCDSEKCLECIKTSTTCTKCKITSALDISTLTCKPCCSRSIHGKVSPVSCCNCPIEFNGYCLNNNQTSGDIEFNGSVGSKKYSKSIYILSFFLIILAFVLLVFSCIMMKSFFVNRKKYGSVLYSALEETN